jgi:hypothetical protein
MLDCENALVIGSHKSASSKDCLALEKYEVLIPFGSYIRRLLMYDYIFLCIVSN